MPSIQAKMISGLLRRETTVVITDWINLYKEGQE